MEDFKQDLNACQSTWKEAKLRQICVNFQEAYKIQNGLNVIWWDLESENLSQHKAYKVPFHLILHCVINTMHTCVIGKFEMVVVGRNSTWIATTCQENHNIWAITRILYPCKSLIDDTSLCIITKWILTLMTSKESFDQRIEPFKFVSIFSAPKPKFRWLTFISIKFCDRDGCRQFT